MRRHTATEQAVWAGLLAFMVIRRKARGLTQEQVATRLGVTPHLVGKWERGVYIPGTTNFIAWAAELGLFVEVNDAESEEQS